MKTNYTSNKINYINLSNMYGGAGENRYYMTDNGLTYNIMISNHAL